MPNALFGRTPWRFVVATVRTVIFRNKNFEILLKVTVIYVPIFKMIHLAVS